MPDLLTPVELAAIAEREAKASKWLPQHCEYSVMDDGYISVQQGAYIGDTLITLGDTYEECGADWDFIAHAREDIPALLRHIAALEAQIKEMSNG